MSELKTGGPGEGPQIDEFKLMESALDHAGPVMGFYYNMHEHLDSRGVDIRRMAEVINDGGSDVIANRIAGIFGTALGLRNLHRSNKRELLTYIKTEHKMLHDESPFLAMQPREAAVFFYQIVILLSQYGIKAENILEVIERKGYNFSEEVADAVKPEENEQDGDERRPKRLPIGEAK